MRFWLQSCTLVRCQSLMLLHHVAAPRRGGEQRAFFLIFALISEGRLIFAFIPFCVRLMVRLLRAMVSVALRVCVVCACVRVIIYAF